MPASHALVPTDRAVRYLTHLCRHTDQVSAHGAGHGGASLPRHVEWSDTEGVIDFGTGRCTLRASDAGLALHAEADDLPRLRRIQEALTTRLELIGRRDRLAIGWQPVPEGDAPASP